MFKCPVCGFLSKSYREVDRHTRLEHPGEVHSILSVLAEEVLEEKELLNNRRETSQTFEEKRLCAFFNRPCTERCIAWTPQGCLRLPSRKPEATVQDEDLRYQEVSDSAVELVG